LEIVCALVGLERQILLVGSVCAALYLGNKLALPSSAILLICQSIINIIIFHNINDVGLI